MSSSLNCQLQLSWFSSPLGPCAGDAESILYRATNPQTVATTFSMTDSDHDPNSLRVVTWNIKFGLDIPGAISALTEVDELRGASIICLQEMDEIGTGAIAEALGYQWGFTSATVHPQTGRDFGNAILTPSHLERYDAVPLPHDTGPQITPRLAVWGSTIVNGRPIDIGSVHSETPVLALKRRIDQFAAVATGPGITDVEPLLVGGDFNTASRRSIAALTTSMDSVGLTRLSVSAGWTLERARRRFTLDHLFGRGFEVLDNGVVRGLAASDHAPLWVRLRFLDPPSSNLR
jgi:endonuclease/exonuclease/phosphatase family metal-dependent hydrolase